MFVRWGIEILNVDKNSTDYSVSYFNLGGLELLFKEDKPTKSPSWRRDCFSLLETALRECLNFLFFHRCCCSMIVHYSEIMT